MQDTIASIATAKGRAGIAIVRISGGRALPIAKQIFEKKKKGAWQSHRLYYGTVQSDGEKVDEAMAVYMKAPNSYTREDVAEIHCHGGDLAAQKVLNAALHAGARPAEPGEFTKRAFLNGRIALNQAEAVMELIDSRTDRAHKNALSHMGTRLYEEISAMQRVLLDVAAALEAFIDYPGEDEEIEATAVEGAKKALLPVARKLKDAIEDSKNAEILNEGVKIVLLGKPNAGKSSLLNRLLGTERAIVTEIPGTTRDVLREHASLYGVPVIYSDTAGLRKAQDAVEKIGVERAMAELQTADVCLLVLDSAQSLETQADLPQLDNSNLLIALNKMDLAPVIHDGEVQALFPGAPVIKTCAANGEGVEGLKQKLYEMAVQGASPEEGLLQNERQRLAAKSAADALLSADAALNSGLMDCAALDIHTAYMRLGLITGETADETIIDRIFERFCLGK